MKKLFGQGRFVINILPKLISSYLTTSYGNSFINTIMVSACYNTYIIFIIDCI